jgi:bifunctional non-homologous end joining protein LigD
MTPQATPRGPLATYNAKRNFRRTVEPRGKVVRAPGNRFLVQKHEARRLHYDFRLELDGVLLSWAVTRGPSPDPAEKRLAVRTEDHPVGYADFEGTIPAGEYGGGTVMLWDRGTWTPRGDPRAGLRGGKLRFELDGERMRGEWMLIRMGGQKRESWLLRKLADDETGPAEALTEMHRTSVKTGRSMEDIASGRAAPARRKVARRKAPVLAKKITVE